MPLVMLRPSRPSPFRRTIQRGKKSVQLFFEHGKPIELSEADIKQLQKDLTAALVPARKDEKGKPRAIYEDVIAVDDTKKQEQKTELKPS